jgi:methyl-accepting chemotaxis protein
LKDNTVINRGFTSRLVILVLLTFIVFSSLSGLAVYFRTYHELGQDYGAAISIISQVRNSMFSETIWINVIFYLLVLAGVVIIGIIYTHRIAGPLYRIRAFAKEVAGGDLSSTLRFRKNDAIHPLADRLNSLVGNYRHKIESLNANLQKMRSEIERLKKGEEADLSAIEEIDRNIKRELEQLNQ